MDPSDIFLSFVIVAILILIIYEVCIILGKSAKNNSETFKRFTLPFTGNTYVPFYTPKIIGYSYQCGDYGFNY